MKTLQTYLFVALFLLGFILIIGCSETKAPTAPAGEQSLLKSSDDDDDDDDDELVISVVVDLTTFKQVDLGGGVGPFNVEGDTGSGSGTFQCWGWLPQNGIGNVSQVYNIAGGSIMTQGQEGSLLAIVGGTGDFNEVKGEALQVFTGPGFDFTITFFLDD